MGDNNKLRVVRNDFSEEIVSPHKGRHLLFQTSKLRVLHVPVSQRCDSRGLPQIRAWDEGSSPK